MLVALVYVSQASKTFTDTDLVNILRSSKHNNEANDITGMLLYNGESFMQVLEGEKDAVLGLYRKISGDRRHRLARVIYQRMIDARSFGDWQMGFKDLTEIDPTQLEGYSDFLSRPLTDDVFTSNPNRVHLFLELFRQQGNL